MTRPRLAVALEYTLIAGGFALDVLETVGHFRRRLTVFCEDGQRAVDDGCAEYEALRGPLADLVRLKDGPRDDAYRAEKDAAWEAARVALRSSQAWETEEA